MKWYFIRHGEIESNRKKIYAGWSEEELTPKGRRQSIKVARELGFFEIERIYTSPLKRAVQTAEIICDFLKKTPIVERSFKELRLGIWQGMHEEEVARDYPEEWETWKTRPAELFLQGRETLYELLERLLLSMRRIAAVKNRGNVAVITHAAAIRVLQLYSAGRCLNEYRRLPVPANGSVVELEFENGDKRCSWPGTSRCA
jgi:alpha-ribazole phosphatase/probable phosphoglycerate mutase